MPAPVDQAEFEAWKKRWTFLRQQCRTDLFVLANRVLGYDWICHKVHDDMINWLPKYVGGTDDFDDEKKVFYGYKPHKEIWEIEGARDRLLLYPRGTLKTTVATVGHIIQFIINFPDARVALVTAVGEQGQAVFDEIRKHFQLNERFRWLFPELCPPARKASDWGNQEQFTVPGRRRHRKEPTLMRVSIGKVIAGYHFDYMAFCDIVDVNNVGTPGQVLQTIRFVGYCEPLIERYPNKTKGLRIVEGTPYDYADYYGVIRDNEENKPEDKKEWKILVRSAKNADGTALWEERLPISELERMEKDPTIGPYIVSSQYYCNPVPISGGLASREQILFVPGHLIRQLLPMMRVHVTIDLAGMEPGTKVNDDTVLNVSGFDRDGRVYAIDIRAGKFSPFDVIQQIFELQNKYRPVDFKIEKDAHARVLLPFLKRECEKRQIWPLMVPIRRDNRVSKKHRIRGLQAWFQTGNIRFSEDLSCKAELVSQILRFSDTSTYHDDILDTVADQLQNRDGGASYDLLPNQERGRVIPFRQPENRFLGFDPVSYQAQWSAEMTQANEMFHDRVTGL